MWCLALVVIVLIDSLSLGSFLGSLNHFFLRFLEETFGDDGEGLKWSSGLLDIVGGSIRCCGTS